MVTRENQGVVGVTAPQPILFNGKMLKIHICYFLRQMLAIFVLSLIYLDTKHFQLYFAAQFGHLSAKFALAHTKNVDVLTIFVNFRYFDMR